MRFTRFEVTGQSVQVRIVAGQNVIGETVEDDVSLHEMISDIESSQIEVTSHL